MDLKPIGSGYLFKIKSKHVFKDTVYDLKLVQGYLILQNQLLEPKYKLPLNLDQMVDWHFSPKNGRLDSFSFEWKGKEKRFYGDPFDIMKLKEILRGQVMFDNISKFYLPVSAISILDANFRVLMIQHNKILLAKNLQEQHDALIKSFEKQDNNDPPQQNDFFQEVALLQKISLLKPQEQQYFIGIRELYNGQSNRFIVFEHGKPYSLQDELNHRDQYKLKRFTLREVKIIFKQILSALDILHLNNVIMKKTQIVHRNIAPKNIIFCQQENGDLLSIRLFDFSQACSVDIQLKQGISCVTPAFNNQDSKVDQPDSKFIPAFDMLRVGQLLYMMMLGKDLGLGKDDSLTAIINMDSLKCIDYRAADLIKKLLTPVVNHRLTADEALLHDFFQGECIPGGLSSMSLSKSYSNGISNGISQRPNSVSINLNGSKASKDGNDFNFLCEEIHTQNSYRDQVDNESGVGRVNHFPHFRKPSLLFEPTETFTLGDEAEIKDLLQD